MNTIDTSKVTNCKYSLKSLTAEMPWCKTLEIKRKHYTETRRPKTQRPIADCRFSVAINCRVLSLAGELLVQVQGAMDGWLVRGSVCSSALDMQCNSALVKFISSSSFPRATPRKTRTQTTDGRTDGWMNLKRANSRGTAALRRLTPSRCRVARWEDMVLALRDVGRLGIAEKLDKAMRDLERRVSWRRHVTSMISRHRWGRWGQTNDVESSRDSGGWLYSGSGEPIDQSQWCLNGRVDSAGRVILIAQCRGESTIVFNCLVTTSVP